MTISIDEKFEASFYDMEIDKKDIQLESVDINATIYAYFKDGPKDGIIRQYDPLMHKRPVYVGQTINPVQTRDNGHLNCHQTKFDHQYTSRDMYSLAIICVQIFPGASSNNEFRKQTLRPATDWLDAKEIEYIEFFDTYYSGYNCTKGGQGLYAITEAFAKSQYLKWRDVYIPEMYKVFRSHETVNVRPHYPVIGRLLERIKNGKQNVPIEFRELLYDTFKFDDRNQEGAECIEKWNSRYIPAFETELANHGHINNIKASHQVLGNVMQCIRTGISCIPREYISLMYDRYKLYTCKQAGLIKQLEQLYTPDIQKSALTNNYIVKSEYPILCSLITKIRYNKIPVPLKYEKLVNGIGIYTKHVIPKKSDKEKWLDRWKKEYIPLFETVYHNHCHPNFDFKPARKIDNRLPSLLRRIREGKEKVPDEYRRKIIEMNFLFCTDSIAKHVSLALGRQVNSIDEDEEARRILIRAALCNKYRYGAKFGLGDIVDGIMAYNREILQFAEDGTYRDYKQVEYKQYYHELREDYSSWSSTLINYYNIHTDCASRTIDPLYHEINKEFVLEQTNRKNRGKM